MNVWSFTGNLGGDAETRFTSGGDAVTSFSIAVKSGYGEKATTVWAKCAIFGKRGESVSQYLTKGTQVGVSGELSMREWEDKEGGKRTSLEVRVNDVTLLGSKDKAMTQEPKRTARKPDQDVDQEIPF